MERLTTGLAQNQFSRYKLQRFDNVAPRRLPVVDGSYIQSLRWNKLGFHISDPRRVQARFQGRRMALGQEYSNFY